MGFGELLRVVFRMRQLVLVQQSFLPLRLGKEWSDVVSEGVQLVRQGVQEGQNAFGADEKMCLVEGSADGSASEACWPQFDVIFRVEVGHFFEI